MSSRIGGRPAATGPAPSFSGASEDAAMVAAARDDERAFRVLIERYQDMVYDLCLRMLGQRQDAEDAAQDAFVSLYRHLEAYDPQRSLSNWLYTIALNECRHRLRRRRLLSFFSLDAPGDEERVQEPAAPEDPPDAALEAEEEDALARRAIESLPETLRGAFVLRYLKKMSCRDVATALKVPLSNVKVRLHRARALLYKRFGSAGTRTSPG